MQKPLVEKLRSVTDAEVIDEPRELTRYSRDQSIYERLPLAVVVPRETEDVVATMQTAVDAGVPITVRGGGSGTAGAALGNGIVIAFPRNGPMSRILASPEDLGAPSILVQPGVLHDDLQACLALSGLFLPADPSSGGMCVVGGNVATKASGPHALKHGSIDRYLLDCEVVLGDGTVVDTRRPESLPVALRDGLLRWSADLRSDTVASGRLRECRERKIASGYNLFCTLSEVDPAGMTAQLMCGSVATLGILTRIRLRGEPRPPGRATSLLMFRELEDAGEAVQGIRELGVAAIEIVNRRTLDIVREKRGPSTGVPDTGHMLLVEYTGVDRLDQIQAVLSFLKVYSTRLVCSPITLDGEVVQDELWKTRKALLPIIRSYSPTLKPLSVVNDVGVPVTEFAPFIREIEQLFDAYAMPLAVYGHAGSGNLHLRPLFDVSKEGLSRQIEHVACSVYDLVIKHGGTITAEHGMGPLRAPFLEQEWGASLYAHMRRLKRLFDTAGILNPGAMFPHGSLIDSLRSTF